MARLALVAVGVAVLAALPLVVSAYTVSLLISILAYVSLATAWAFFSGRTRYISLATAAFVGIGTYTVALLGDHLPLPLVLAIAPVVGFAVAFGVGLSTLRLSGVYFVIFTFGLAELIKQLVIWFEINQTKTLARYIFVNAGGTLIYELLLAIAAVVIGGVWWLSQARLGYALRVIGEDEMVARHAGIDTTRVKVLVFAATSAVMSLVGAVLSLRYTYVDPNIAFNSLVAFQVLIMALLGGVGRPWGPALGAVPLVLLFELLSGTFPHHFGIALGLCFVIIVYYLPGGLMGLVDRVRGRAP
ncbi:branched-chain amino acid ABC transporter permease [Vineibacter terrae]|uniref:Branched-chain amino acid ABC transporter permease n=1 Tax=Vineibacter terrae TaxID=2586908 RepID=A0A5C8PVJ1_9HYPH|nr:branched-chain amino acid ABC transporter permease [Vineibacter terrae]TXL82035.1 branched-chain amino acid ABC transporter permease [Vineibacter terrae]